MAEVQEKITYCRICEGLLRHDRDGRGRPRHAAPSRHRPRALARLRVSQGRHLPPGDPRPRSHPASDEARGHGVAAHLLGAGRQRDRQPPEAHPREHGPHAIGLYTGNPAGYSYSHRIFSSNWIDAVGSRNSFGAGSQDNLGDFLASKFLYGASFLQPVPDLARTRWALVVGTNPVVSQGTLMHVVDAKRRLEEIRARGGRVVVVDPRRTETARVASEHHFIRPESDAFLFLAMIRTILEEGLEARDLLARHASDLPWLREAVAPHRHAGGRGGRADGDRRGDDRRRRPRDGDGGRRLRPGVGRAWCAVASARSPPGRSRSSISSPAPRPPRRHGLLGRARRHGRHRRPPRTRPVRTAPPSRIGDYPELLGDAAERDLGRRDHHPRARTRSVRSW